MRRATAIGVLAASLALAACGEDDREGSFTSESGTGTETTGTGTTGTETTPAPTGEASQTFAISEVDFRLEPASFTLAEPGIVEFAVENDGKAPHALEVEGPTGEVETEEIQPGGTATLKADVSQAGTYKLYCPIGDHEQRGMVGELVVGGGQGGTDEPGDEGGDNSGSGGDGEGGGTPAPEKDDSGGTSPPSAY